MKKLFTLIALLACFLGAKAEWVVDYSIDYSTKSGFPFYVMGYVPEWVNGVMTDYGANFKYVEAKEDAEETSDVVVKTDAGVEYYKIALAEPGWHQYFIADGIPTELDGAYTVKALVKASEACTINVNMGWGWNEGQSMGASVAIPASDDFQEVEWEYSGIGGTSCNLVAQPGTVTATIEWKSVTVSHNQKAQRPVEWIEHLTNGNAEGEWPAWSLEQTDGINANWRGDRPQEICAWALTMGRNYDDQDNLTTDTPRSRPYPADIEAEPGNPSNHVFAVHATRCEIINEDDANSYQWANQFWIQSPQPWKEGTQIKIHFRYKADKAVTAGTQIHKQNPSVYLHWEGIGDVNFTEEWQEFDKVITFNGSQATGWSVAFNLNSNTKPEEFTPTTFYFDDLSWQTMKLDEGLFVAASNTTTGIEYDLDNAAEMTYDEDLQAYTATVGTIGKQDTWVNEIMVSTIRGNDAAFKGATLKPTGNYIGEDNWDNYTEASVAKIKLPAAGVWQVNVDTEQKQMNLVKLEGEEDKKPLDIKPNPTVVVVHGQERDDLADSTNQDGSITINEEEGGTGQPWDNQFFLVANRKLSTGEVTVVSFKYKASVDGATSGTQLHGDPGAYMHWNAIGSLTFTNEWQDFSTTLTIPSEANDMRSIAFNLAEIKGACDYELKDFVWKLEDNMETLINETGAENFYVKEGAGTDPHEFGKGEQGVHSVVANGTVSNVKYNLAGQRVNTGYKGIVVKNGSKYFVK